ncbi:MAG: sulfurtransferase TusA [Gammaproteobacteria bacterium]|nr:sulfurtransferase TusA [Zhongshania sp.]MBU0538993.1 sulfurtransferase TusA [Gammaproteobacteria bacterium]MBU1833438.1 sulfurtransferase TusA [Gammaproteobacteria bacterium]
MAIVADHTLDTCGLFCPEPVMMLHNKIRDITSGDILEVVATDPATTRDIPKFCNFLGHELLAQEERAGQYHYFLKKA